MSGLDPVRQIAREWIRFAQGELNAARTLAENRDDNLPALSALPSDRFPAIHQIGSLASLNPYAVATRYPMMHAANPLRACE
jgi:hypothetical protein